MAGSSSALLLDALIVFALATWLERARRAAWHRRRRGRGSPLDTFDVATPAALTAGMTLVAAEAATRASWRWLPPLLALAVGMLFGLLAWCAFRSVQHRRPTTRLARAFIMLAAFGLCSALAWLGGAMGHPGEGQTGATLALGTLAAVLLLRLSERGRR